MKKILVITLLVLSYISYGEKIYVGDYDTVRLYNNHSFTDNDTLGILDTLIVFGYDSIPLKLEFPFIDTGFSYSIYSECHESPPFGTFGFEFDQAGNTLIIKESGRYWFTGDIPVNVIIVNDDFFKLNYTVYDDEISYNVTMNEPISDQVVWNGDTTTLLSYDFSNEGVFEIEFIDDNVGIYTYNYEIDYTPPADFVTGITSGDFLYFNPEPDISTTFSLAGIDFYLDINSDGVNDFQFLVGIAIIMGGASTQHYCNIHPLNQNSVNINCNNKVGFYQDSSILTNFSWSDTTEYGEFDIYDYTDHENQFIAIQVNIGGTDYQGWIRTSVNESIFTIHDWAIKGLGTEIKESSSKKILIYPNPASDIINIKSDEEIESILVIDIYGRKVLEESQSERINIQYLPSGIYIIWVKSEGRIYQEKIVKS